MMLEPGYPCPYCQVRPDVDCRHRPADPNWKRPEQQAEPPKRDIPGSYQGLNFGTRKYGGMGGGQYGRKGRPKA
jgi:hypothetical protein